MKTHFLPFLGALAFGLFTSTGQAAETATQQKVIAFAEAHLGARTPASSAGECTDLVSAALASANAVPGNFSNAPYYTWGRPILFGPKLHSGRRVPYHLLGKPGYIIQFVDCHFQTANSSSDYPKHSAIIESANGSILTLLNQNVNGQRVVVRSTVDLTTLVKGSYKFYSPLPRS